MQTPWMSLSPIRRLKLNDDNNNDDQPEDEEEQEDKREHDRGEHLPEGTKKADIEEQIMLGKIIKSGAAQKSEEAPMEPTADETTTE